MLNKVYMNVPLMFHDLFITVAKLIIKNLPLDEKINNIVCLQCRTSLKALVLKQLHVQKHIEASMRDQSNKVLYNLQRAVHDNKVLCNLSMNKLWCAIVL